MKLSKREYARIVEEHSPRSPLWKDLLLAFLVGGGICTIGQAVQNGFAAMGLEEEQAGTATCVTMIFFSAVLTALSLYDNLAKFAGAGTLVPITGFANAVVAPAVEFRSEGYILGVGTKLFSIAGPVIVYGTAASVVYGIIYWIAVTLL